MKSLLVSEGRIRAAMFKYAQDISLDETNIKVSMLMTKLLDELNRRVFFSDKLICMINSVPFLYFYTQNEDSIAIDLFPVFVKEVGWLYNSKKMVKIGRKLLTHLRSKESAYYCTGCGCSSFDNCDCHSF